MSDRDDDFLDHGGDDFDAESDEFHIPEDPHGDDGFLTEEDEEFTLSEDDVLDISGTEEGDEWGGQDDSINLDEPFGDQSTAQGVPEPEEEPEYDGAEPQEAKLGWKIWAGTALIVVVFVGFVVYMVPPTSGGSGNAQASEQLPEPPPAPSATSDKVGPTSAQVSPPPPANGNVAEQRPSRANAPVSVAPFPAPEITGNERDAVANAQPPSPVAAPSSTWDESEVAQTYPNMDQGTLYDHGADLEPAEQIEVGGITLDDVHEEMVDGYRSENEYDRIPSTQHSRDDREPEFIRALNEQRQAFSALLSATQDNGRQIAGVRRELTQYQSQTTRAVSDLDERVGKLEKLFNDTGAPVKTSAKSKKSDIQRDKLAVAGGRQVPRSPEEIKELQRKLKEFNYRPGFVDGIFGGQTRWAIKRLQQEHGLERTGWLNQETLAALANPKRYSGTYDEEAQQTANNIADAGGRSPEPQAPSKASGGGWYVRGVTPTKALVYREDGLTYTVRVGTEIPDMGQVTRLEPEKWHVVTPNGVITRR